MGESDEINGNDGKKGQLSVLSPSEAIEMALELAERWPNQFGERSIKRFSKALEGRPKVAFERAFNELMLKSEFPFSYDRLHQLANGYTQTYDVNKFKREWKNNQRKG